MRAVVTDCRKAEPGYDKYAEDVRCSLLPLTDVVTLNVITISSHFDPVQYREEGTLTLSSQFTQADIGYDIDTVWYQVNIAKNYLNKFKDDFLYAEEEETVISTELRTVNKNYANNEDDYAKIFVSADKQSAMSVQATVVWFRITFLEFLGAFFAQASAIYSICAFILLGFHNHEQRNSMLNTLYGELGSTQRVRSSSHDAYTEEFGKQMFRAQIRERRELSSRYLIYLFFWFSNSFCCCLQRFWCSGFKRRA